jgi:hypothetical protein
MGEEPAWAAAQRVEAWAGEVRVNLIRIVAVAAFYGHHLANLYFRWTPLPPGFHTAATAAAIAWAAGAAGLHLLLQDRKPRPALPYAAVAFDGFLLTGLLLLTDGPRTPLVLLYFLLVATSILRLRIDLVWIATLVALAGYAAVLGFDRWGRDLAPELRVPRTHQVMTAIGLVCMGLLAGQAVRQARRFAREYADRVRP